ncbi:hypothetical protein [Liquorilactobacillus satsumensis]|uniref:hypothetical protein n=1 Tax=Liquorilactobacillus satsumensis TaxID=259059 RepID=UPI00345CEA19
MISEEAYEIIHQIDRERGWNSIKPTDERLAKLRILMSYSSKEKQFAETTEKLGISKQNFADEIRNFNSIRGMAEKFDIERKKVMDYIENFGLRDLYYDYVEKSHAYVIKNNQSGYVQTIYGGNKALAKFFGVANGTMQHAVLFGNYKGYKIMRMQDFLGERDYSAQRIKAK